MSGFLHDVAHNCGCSHAVSLVTVPIAKAGAPPALDAQIVGISRVMTSQFNVAAQDAIEETMDKISSMSKMSEADIDGLVANLETQLGPKFAKVVEKDLRRSIMAMYMASRFAGTSKLGFSASLGLADKQTIKWLGKSYPWWVSGFHKGNLSEKVTAVMADALQQGLPRRKMAALMESQLGKVYGLVSGATSVAVPGVFTGSPAQYWGGLANHAGTTARTFADLETFQQGGFKKYTIRATGDRRTCRICLGMSGKSFSVKQGMAQRDKVLGAKSPGEYKAVSGWHRVGPSLDIIAGGQEKMVSGGMSLPTYHFLCRCWLEADMSSASTTALRPVPRAKPKPKLKPKAKAKPAWTGTPVRNRAEMDANMRSRGVVDIHLARTKLGRTEGMALVDGNVAFDVRTIEGGERLRALVEELKGFWHLSDDKIKLRIARSAALKIKPTIKPKIKPVTRPKVKPVIRPKAVVRPSVRPSARPSSAPRRPIGAASKVGRGTIKSGKMPSIAATDELIDSPIKLKALSVNDATALVKQTGSGMPPVATEAELFASHATYKEALARLERFRAAMRAHAYSPKIDNLIINAEKRLMTRFRPLNRLVNKASSRSPTVGIEAEWEGWTARSRHAVEQKFPKPVRRFVRHNVLADETMTESQLGAAYRAQTGKTGHGDFGVGAWYEAKPGFSKGSTVVSGDRSKVVLPRGARDAQRATVHEMGHGVDINLMDGMLGDMMLQLPDEYITAYANVNGREMAAEAIAKTLTGGAVQMKGAPIRELLVRSIMQDQASFRAATMDIMADGLSASRYTIASPKKMTKKAAHALYKKITGINPSTEAATKALAKVGLR